MSPARVPIFQGEEAAISKSRFRFQMGLIYGRTIHMLIPLWVAFVLRLEASR